MASFVKKKNMVFIKDDNSNVTIDLNTLNITIDNKSVERLPDFVRILIRKHNFSSAFEDGFYEAIYYLINDDNYSKENKIKVFNFLDRLMSVGIRADSFYEVMNHVDILNDYIISGALVSYLKEFEDGRFSHSYYNRFKYLPLKEKYNVSRDDYCTLINIFSDVNNDVKYLEYGCLLVGFRNIAIIESWYDCFTKYYTMSMEMNNCWIASKHFFDDYCKMDKEYSLFLDKKKNEQLSKKKNDSLLFTYGDYTVIYPNSVEQFKDEANQQNNCVYRIYMERFIDGDCEIVFIRNKNNINKSVITCEIDPRSKRIQQFLLKNNDRDIPSDLQQFKCEYQKYLNGETITDDDDDDDEEYDEDEDDEII